MTRLYQVAVRLFVEADSEDEAEAFVEAVLEKGTDDGGLRSGPVVGSQVEDVEMDVEDAYAREQALCAACDEPRGAKR